ncbi:hypothetical protein NPIL_599801 [Nephila pilipes]|uniref:Uncharacterized protein n=1 Tax=Nephila pilipes TaxID=299642 RepID=A0A8X6MCX1_NEPPI|nr:hypothetical protein NPIL_599801 [Nephila pilipes]
MDTVTVSFPEIGSNCGLVVLKEAKDFLEPAKQRLYDIVQDLEAKCRLENKPNPGPKSYAVPDRRSCPTNTTCRRRWKQARILSLGVKCEKTTTIWKTPANEG